MMDAQWNVGAQYTIQVAALYVATLYATHVVALCEVALYATALYTIHLGGIASNSTEDLVYGYAALMRHLSSHVDGMTRMRVIAAGSPDLLTSDGQPSK